MLTLREMSRRLGVLTWCLSVSLGLFAQTAESEAVLIPADIRRPQSSEAPRYPRDVVIGELGSGAAPLEVYRYARRLLAALLRDNRDSEYLAGLGSATVETLAESVAAIEPRSVRIGGGREEADGSVSFLFRFIGREQGMAGELYLRRQEDEDGWYCDDLIIEESRDIPERGSPYRYDFSPYERFF